MKLPSRAIAAITSAAVASFALTGCGGGDAIRGSHNLQQRPSEAMDANSIWKLRSGLNVAALTCRGSSRTSVASAYRKLLVRHGVMLKSAYDTEVRRLGLAAFDKDQTRVYNRFANQPSPTRFCRAAARIAQSSAKMDPSRLSASARHLVNQLDEQRRN